MIIVISCAGSKRGDLLRHNEQYIAFCATPSIAPNDGKNYVHPDEQMNGQTWREWINDHQSDQHLIESNKLYKLGLYRELLQKYNDKLYIFSAGWGIVHATFRLPVYDITFSQLKSEEKFKQRKFDDSSFNDYNHLKYISSNEDILFIAGAAYMLPFCRLTAELSNKKHIIYKSKLNKEIKDFAERPDFSFEEYSAIAKPFTNWHYAYANSILLNK